MTLPSAGFRRETGLARRWPLVIHPRELTIDALTGQVGTLTRATTAATTDENGVSRTLNRHQPRWEKSGGVGYLRLGAAAGALTEYVTYPCDLTLTSLSGLVRFVEAGTAATGDTGGAGASTIFAIANAAVTGARISVYAANNGKYTAEYHSGSSSVASQQTGSIVSDGQLITLRWSLVVAGGNATIQLWQSVNGAAEVAASVSSSVATGALGTTTLYWLNAMGAVQDYGSMLFGGAVVGLGNQSQADLLEALA